MRVLSWSLSPGLTLVLMVWWNNYACMTTVSGFLLPHSSTRHQQRSISHKMSEVDSTPLPPANPNRANKYRAPTKGGKRGSAAGKSGNGDANEWFRKMPKVIPKLSDVMSGATPQDFVGDIEEMENIAMFPRRIVTATSPINHLESKSRDDATDRTMNQYAALNPRRNSQGLLDESLVSRTPVQLIEGELLPKVTPIELAHFELKPNMPQATTQAANSRFIQRAARTAPKGHVEARRRSNPIKPRMHPNSTQTSPRKERLVVVEEAEEVLMHDLWKEKAMDPRGQTGMNSNRTINSRRRVNPVKPAANRNETGPARKGQATAGNPWNASLTVSKQTQAELKAVEARYSNPLKRATAVLRTLLTTPPSRCNEANVVCALTMSAKTMTTNTPVTEEFRDLLLKTLDVLHDLVLNKKLSSRQLCNAIWAVGKHYNRINSILPPPPLKVALSSDKTRGVAESWSFHFDDETPERRLDHTVDVIADQLTKILTMGANIRREKLPKVGEIAMASWAYGILRQRKRPPGWDGPPQLGRLPQTDKSMAQGRRDLITFEQWTTSEEVVQTECTPDCAGLLFDAISRFLCQVQTEGENKGEPMLSSLSWREIANVAWAYASKGHCRTPESELLLMSISQETHWRIRSAQAMSNDQFLPRDVAQVVWSLGTLQSDNFRLGDDLVSLVDAISSRWLVNGTGESFRTWSNADLVQLAISMAHARIDNQEVIKAVYEESLRRIHVDDDRQGFQTWEVSVLLWIQARLYLKEAHGQIYADFSKEATNWLLSKVQRSSSMEQVGIGPQEQANLAWSLTVLEQYEIPSSVALLREIFKEASSSGEKNEFIQLEHAHQLWQALYLMEYECPEAVENVPAWFRDFLKEKWAVEKARHKTSSARHRSLSQCLDLMGVAHYNEHDEDIDVAIVLKESSAWTHKAKREDHEDAVHKVAVEFDGPNHFTREDSGGKPRALGHTVLKYRLLKRQGWAVVRVPYYEFDKIPFWASMERQRYLQRLLKTHANIRFSDVDVSEYKRIVPNRKTRFD